MIDLFYSKAVFRMGGPYAAPRLNECSAEENAQEAERRLGLYPRRKPLNVLTVADIKKIKLNLDNGLSGNASKLLRLFKLCGIDFRLPNNQRRLMASGNFDLEQLVASHGSWTVVKSLTRDKRFRSLLGASDNICALLENPRFPQSERLSLIKNKYVSPKGKEVVVSDPRTSSVVLDLCTHSKYPLYIRIHVARNTSTKRVSLRKLIKNSNEIRLLKVLGLNPKCDIHVLQRLFKKAPALKADLAYMEKLIAKLKINARVGKVIINYIINPNSGFSIDVQDEAQKRKLNL